MKAKENVCMYERQRNQKNWFISREREREREREEHVPFLFNDHLMNKRHESCYYSMLRKYSFTHEHNV